jgi:hypothetical protein
MKTLMCILACLLFSQISHYSSAIEPGSDEMEPKGDTTLCCFSLDMRSIKAATPCDPEQAIYEIRARLRELGIVTTFPHPRIHSDYSNLKNLLFVGSIYYVKFGPHQPDIFKIGYTPFGEQPGVVQIWFKPLHHGANIVLIDCYGFCR